MRKGPLNPKYIRVEDRIGLITERAFRTGKVVGIEDNTQVVGLDKIIETVIFEETLEGMEDKIIEEDIGMIGIMIIVEVGTGQEKGHLQEIIVVIEREAQVIVDLGLALEPVQIEIGLGLTIVENMTITQEIAPNSREEKDLEQLQQMLNMEAEEQTYRQDRPIENYRSPLNL